METPEVNTNGLAVQYDAVESDEEESDHLLKNSSLSSAVVEDAPHDRSPSSFKAVYLIFFLLGVCSVLPWNMFITAKSYFAYKFRNVTGNGTEDSALDSSFEGYFSVAAMVPSIIFQLLNLALQHRISLQTRIIVPLLGMLALFVVTTIFAKVDTDEWQITFFAVCISTVVLINATSDEDSSGFIYFLFSVVCILITILAFLMLPRNKYASYFLNKYAEMTKIKSRELESTESFEKVARHERPPFGLIFWKIKVPAIMVLLVFAVTLGLFPGTLAYGAAMNADNKNWAKYFSPVACFLVFNTMDFTGRTLAGIQWPKPNHMPLISLLVLLRLVFFPLFAFCNLHITDHPTTVFFNNDAYFIVFNVLFGLSNGYLGSLLMIYGPKFVDVKHSETAGVMMSLFLAAGLAVGSVISVLFLKIV
ncbi:equilibrative nucleoside transporter 3-like isoform X3 [Patiria miniata]|uniref:Equilibrative nucleoside transporter 1 n=1 Tax=Patiria miniata TaxID=46514 RepID=A0A914BPZ2_PATMI|nr:equilibrative nucleoside transporter 3-like isoform X3 [Patiria miniata]